MKFTVYNCHLSKNGVIICELYVGEFDNLGDAEKFIMLLNKSKKTDVTYIIKPRFDYE